MFAFLLDPLENSGLTQGLFGLLTNKGLVGLASLISFLCMLAIAYSYIRIKELKEIEKENYAKYFVRVYPHEVKKDTRWETIRGYFLSDSDEKWRLAIIEADALLEEGLKNLLGDGATLGEMLKKNPPQIAPIIQQVWGVHLLRNKIAHEGMMFVIDRRISNHAYQVFETALKMIGKI